MRVTAAYYFPSGIIESGCSKLDTGIVGFKNSFRVNMDENCQDRMPPCVIGHFEVVRKQKCFIHTLVLVRPMCEQEVNYFCCISQACFRSSIVCLCLFSKPPVSFGMAAALGWWESSPRTTDKG